MKNTKLLVSSISAQKCIEDVGDAFRDKLVFLTKQSMLKR